MLKANGPQKTAVYRLYDAADVLLYIGMSYAPHGRFELHRYQSAWWPQVARHEITWFASRPKARAAEAAAIREERPLYNVKHACAKLPDRPAAGPWSTPPRDT